MKNYQVKLINCKMRQIDLNYFSAQLCETAAAVDSKELRGGT